MKKFMALVVLLFILVISSTASATLTDIYPAATKNQILCMTMRELFKASERKMADPDYEPLSEENLKEFSEAFNSFRPTTWSDVITNEQKNRDKERQHEFYQLAFTVMLTVGLVMIILLYKYKNCSMVKSNSFMLWFSNFIYRKNFWLLVFCVVSLTTCIFYVPYNMVRSENPGFIIKTAHDTIFDIPENFNPRTTHIDYQAILFREMLILIGCCAVYTVSTIIKKE